MNIATSPTGWARNPDGSPGYTWNPLSGCRNHTPEGLCLGGLFPCYAWKLGHGRLKPLYLANKNFDLPFPQGGEYGVAHLDKALHDPFYPRFWEERLAELTKRNDRLYYDGEKTKYAISPRGIFVCDMGDLFGVGVPAEQTEKVLDEILGNKGYDRFYLLTKQAARLPEFSPFPENCWVGVTATNTKGMNDALYFNPNYEAKVKFISFEPLLEHIDNSRLALYRYDWLIIGACTGTLNEMQTLRLRYPELSVKLLGGNKWTLQPKIEWVREIESAARKAGVAIFEKDNLHPLLKRDLIQELPK